MEQLTPTVHCTTRTKRSAPTGPREHERRVELAALAGGLRVFVRGRLGIAMFEILRGELRRHLLDLRNRLLKLFDQYGREVLAWLARSVAT